MGDSDFQPLLRFVLWYMNLNQMNPMKSSRLINLLNYFSVFTLIVYVIWYIVGFVTQWVDINSISEANLLPGGFVVLIKGSTLVYYRDRLKNTILLTKGFWRPSQFPDHEAHLKKLHRNAFVTVLIFYIVAYIASVPTMLFPIIANTPHELPIKVYPLCDLKTTPCYEVHYAYLLGYCYYQFVPIHLYFEGLFVAAIAYSYVGIEILKISINELDLENLPEEEALAKLNVIIEQHMLILKFIKEIRQFFMLPLFGFFFFTAGSEIAALYMLTRDGIPPDFDHIITYCPVVFIYFTQILYYCIPAAIIKDQILSLGDAIYDVKWYSKTNACVRKQMAFMILRTQLDESFTIGNMTKLNLETFVATARVIFSFYTLLSESSKKLQNHKEETASFP